MLRRRVSLMYVQLQSANDGNSMPLRCSEPLAGFAPVVGDLPEGIPRVNRPTRPTAGPRRGAQAQPARRVDVRAAGGGGPVCGLRVGADIPGWPAGAGAGATGAATGAGRAASAFNIASSSGSGDDGFRL